ncbi:MAG: Dyp-type peroxidase [Candidatus Kapaibacterium sp.]
MKDLNIFHSQTGLAYFPDYAIYATFFLQKHDRTSHDLWQSLATDLDKFCMGTGYRTVVMLGVGFELWGAWSKELGLPLPKGMGSKEVLSELSQAFGNAGGDLWYHIKSDSAEDARNAIELIERRLKGSLAEGSLIVPAEKRHKGKVLGGRFIDGLENPADAEDLSNRVIVGDEDPDHRGGAFLLTQKFVHDWTKLNAMTEQQKQNMIGRDQKDRILAMEDDSSHIKRVRQLDGERINYRIVRQALPYGRATHNKANEKGIFFAGYAQSTTAFDHILHGIAGDKSGFIQDQLFSVTRSEQGSYWYVPNLKECGIEPGDGNEEITMNEYFNVRSANGYMFYNARDYQHKVRSSKLVEDCPISDRILLLINKEFSRWQDTWYRKRETPPLGHLKDYLSADEQDLLTASIALRKGKAIQLSLSKVLISPEYRKRANLMRVDPAEIVVGNMPQLSLGIGSQVMEYLTDDERLTGFFATLNEYSSSGHNAPDYPLLIAKGIDAISAAYQEKLNSASDETKDFYQSVVWALDGLSAFIEAYATLTEEMAADDQYRDEEKANLLAIAERMRKIAHKRPEHFHEALQLVFITNCSLHQTGEPHSIGRLDQQLIDLYEADLKAGRITADSAQEMIDAFWLKMDETVLYNYNHLNDYLTYGTGAVFYSAGNFPQGAAINQWVQQVTVGGYKANDAEEPEDATNAITVMCLRSARRLPLNAPCLSVRLHKKMSETIIAEAAKAVLSGGAHPVLMNDDKMVPALQDCGPVSLEDARDYTCDGCFEAVLVGKTEWAFSYIPILPMVEYSMNQGCNVQGAGPINLRGLKLSWNSPPPETILSFKHFMEIFYTHWKWAISGFFNSLMLNYGTLVNYSPSPLFSAFLSDTLETGRDLTNGGARYHIVAPLFCGIGDAIDSLYAVKKLVFDDESALCSLPQLLLSLQCDWGYDMKPPFYTTTEGAARREADSDFFKQLREAALALPKFGINSDPALRELADEVITTCVQIVHDTLKNPLPEIAAGYEKLKQKYGTPERPFEFTITPGIGTFEDNVGLGLGFGATANGRRNTQPIAADFTAMPQPPDLPFQARTTNAFVSLNDWNMQSIGHGLANGAPNDLNIAENFPEDKLCELIEAFAKSELGSNMMTITCADPSTYEQAMEYPERYDLVRNRTGGWSEFFIAMFDFHQEYIRRRVYYDC